MSSLPLLIKMIFGTTINLQCPLNSFKPGTSKGWSDVTAFWPDGTQKLIVKSQVQKALDYVLESAGPGCTYLMRVDFASEVAAWINGCLWERPPPHDWLIYAYCRTRNYRWHVIPRSNVMYRQHAGNFLGANYGISGQLVDFARFMPEIFDEMWSRFLRFWAVPIKSRHQNVPYCLIGRYCDAIGERRSYSS